jgi:hypothetical protein
MVVAMKDGMTPDDAPIAGETAFSRFHTEELGETPLDENTGQAFVFSQTFALQRTF